MAPAARQARRRHAVPSPGGAIIIPSYELKAAGVKTAMRIRDARLLSPNLIVKQSNPPLYREVHRRFCRMFCDYSPDVYPKSIDEAVILLRGTPALKTRSMEDIGREIKARVKQEIGPWMLVNVGIGPNAFLAKTAAGLHKPDGLDRIDAGNLRETLSALTLMDLTGINVRYEARLNAAGITTPLQFLDAEAGFLCRELFHCIDGFHWYRRLRDYEAEMFTHDRQTFGNSVQLSHPVSPERVLLGIMNKLCHKASARMRQGGFACRTVQLMLRYADGTFYRDHRTLDQPVSSVGDVFRTAVLCFNRQKGRGGLDQRAVTKVCIDLYNLSEAACQQELFPDGEVAQDRRLTEAMDAVNRRYGMYAYTSALVAGLDECVLDRIPFGAMQDLVELYADHEPCPVPAADWGS